MPNGKTSKIMSKAAIRRRHIWALYRAGVTPPEIAQSTLVNCTRQHVYKVLKKAIDDIEKDTLLDVKAVFRRDMATLDHLQSVAYKAATLGDLDAIKTIAGTLIPRRAKMLNYDGLLGTGAEDKPLVLSFDFGKPAALPEEPQEEPPE